MKEGWEIKKLGEVANVRSGKSIEASNISNMPSPYPCYGGNGIRGYVDCYNYDGHFPIIGRVGALCGNVHLAKGKFYATEHALVVEIKDVNINAEWLSFSLEFLKLRSIAKGVAQPVIAANEVAKLPILIPPLPEQERIVSELDCINGILEKKREQIKELDALAQSIFYHMFGDPIRNEMGWEVRKLGEVAPAKEYKGEVPNIDGKYWLLNLDKVVAHSGEIIEQCYFEPGEIGNSTIVFNTENVLYSKLRPYLNKVVVPNDIGLATSELVPLFPNKDCLDRVFLAQALRSSSFVEYISAKVAGAKMPRVSMNDFRDFLMPIPPLSLQQSFATKIEAIETQKELIKRSIAEVETLLASRMHHHFG